MMVKQVTMVLVVIETVYSVMMIKMVTMTIVIILVHTGTHLNNTCTSSSSHSVLNRNATPFIKRLTENANPLPYLHKD